MKKLIIALSIIVSSITFAGEELKVTVKGMVCAFCAQGIEKQFKKQPEIDKVNVSLQDKMVKLTFKDGKRLPNEKITEILKDAGYESIIGEK